MVLKVVKMFLFPFPSVTSGRRRDLGRIYSVILKKWPADGAAALAAPKASRAALAKRHLNKQEGN